MSSDSTIATRSPWSAARPAAVSPAGPAPTTTTSKSVSATGSPRGRRRETAAGPEDLRDGPRLERAAGRVVRCVAVGGLGDRPEPPVGEVVGQPVEDVGGHTGGERGV